MKKGFTLIELMIVIIIIGILATVGIIQYQTAVEKSRGSEAKQFLGHLRGLCAAIYLETEDAQDCQKDDGRDLTIGQTGGIPGPKITDCELSNFFAYAVEDCDQTSCKFVARRCAVNTGKKPGSTKAFELHLTTDFATGNDTWYSPDGTY
ncbi:MAG TPA: prepilin-type N-terminal cleavage/methylation domain-containing protein [Candidatus Omnitrophota bacterium]|nr:prepilin-type N-terminal cleavage/methylation domain-containing protein [Candidatus Omnitrophota bacterium]HRZ15400.1 prepilin-type N-terminal cleavage/methylation domain-containing protein [Candidatus Omnitrophota bacterium]